MKYEYNSLFLNLSLLVLFLTFGILSDFHCLCIFVLHTQLKLRYQVGKLPTFQPPER